MASVAESLLWHSTTDHGCSDITHGVKNIGLIKFVSPTRGEKDPEMQHSSKNEIGVYGKGCKASIVPICYTNDSESYNEKSADDITS